MKKAKVLLLLVGLIIAGTNMAYDDCIKGSRNIGKCTPLQGGGGYKCVFPHEIQTCYGVVIYGDEEG